MYLLFICRFSAHLYTEQFIFTGFVSLQTWRFHGAFSLPNHFEKNMMRMDFISEKSNVYPPPPREESIYLSLLSPHLCNEGVLPHTLFSFLIFGASVISGKPQELHLPRCSLGIIWTIFQILTYYTRGSIYQY